MNKTVNTVLAEVHQVRPDVYGDELLTSWLSELDGKLSTELLKMEAPVQYSYPDDGETELLVPHPYDNLYVLYLIAMMDLYNREIDLYQNDMQVFNRAWSEYASQYRRTHLPKQEACLRVF